MSLYCRDNAILLVERTLNTQILTIIKSQSLYLFTCRGRFWKPCRYVFRYRRNRCFYDNNIFLHFLEAPPIVCEHRKGRIQLFQDVYTFRECIFHLFVLVNLILSCLYVYLTKTYKKILANKYTSLNLVYLYCTISATTSEIIHLN